MSIISDTAKYWRFAIDLRRFLRGTISLEESKQVIATQLQNRGSNFLNLVRKTIYQNPKSPYFKLLQTAGYEYDDLKKLVLADGLEPSLKKLYEAGVYISVEEFKGKQAIVRGGQAFNVKESDFDNPLMPRSLEGSTGGSRSAGTRVALDFTRFYYLAAHNAVTFDAHGISDCPILVWQPILPSVAGLVIIFRLIKMGNPPQRWFSQVEAKAIKPSLKKRLATYYAVYASRFFGAAFPRPEYVNLEQAYIVADCIIDILKRERGCVVFTTPSSAVRVCQVSIQRQSNLSGVTFVLGGEPLTEAKMKEIKTAGAKAINMYAITDISLLSYSCADPTVSFDDIHLRMDSHAVIQHRRETPYGGASVDAFLFTSLMPDTAKILLNVESGDYGVIETRPCNCKLGELGLNEHLSKIASFDKLTGEGMSFVGTDLVRIMEMVLPAKFGGISIDYQMMEEEDEDGHTRLSILVSPEVGEIDEGELIHTVLYELGKGEDTQRMMTAIWAQAGMLRVKRLRPIITAAGKLLSLHIQKVKYLPRPIDRSI
jgi:hypothetical protein